MAEVISEKWIQIQQLEQAVQMAEVSSCLHLWLEFYQENYNKVAAKAKSELHMTDENTEGQKAIDIQ